jgi:hypothetical protein
MIWAGIIMKALQLSVRIKKIAEDISGRNRNTSSVLFGTVL